MTHAAVLEKYVSICGEALAENRRALSFLRKQGITERFVFESFSLGYSDGKLAERIGENEELREAAAALGLLKGQTEVLKHCIVVPVLDENRAIVNLVGVPIHPRRREQELALTGEGVFNAPFLQNCEEVIVCETPLQALLLVEHGIENVTFPGGEDRTLQAFVGKHGIKTAVFTFEGKERLFYELTKAGVSCRRVQPDFAALRDGENRESAAEMLSGSAHGEGEAESEDTIVEIESGFLFRFPLLSYRVIGTFHEHSLTMKANIKAFTESQVFLDSVDLYKHRDRQNFVYNLIDRFDVRDQLQLEQDLTRIVEVIERHKEQKASAKKRTTPALTDYQKDIGTRLLTNPKLLGEIESDYDKLGYVRERVNKLLLYLVMTSRLMENPLHAIAISRSGAGKSQLAEVTESLCPPEDVVSVSDLSAQALFYYGEGDLKHRLIVIGERAGSEGADYPLRELISRKSITKAIPMKDPATSQIKTVSITVEGPIALVETTTSGEINAENLNRCFVISIDESEEQTRLIHELQRQSHTPEGYRRKRERSAIIEKHIYAQRLLRKIPVLNPYAELLTFPSGSLRSRRDNEKLLRLIAAICFLHQYQRPVKTMKISERETLEYIECTVEDYRIAYELLSDGVLENTLDDLPRPARKLFDVIVAYLEKREREEGVAKERIVFERKDIREYSSWSFAQVRNNMRILTDYEYLKLTKAQSGVATQYRLASGYRDPDFMAQILSPEELAKRLRSGNSDGTEAGSTVEPASAGTPRA